MNISKENINYKGKDYPAVSVELTDSEAYNHNDGIHNLLFSDLELWDKISMQGEPDSDSHPDSDIDFYLDSHVCERYHKGEISDGEMKVKAARVILSWE